MNNIREIFVSQFRTKKFLTATIIFSVFSLLLYADLPVIVLLAIGMWRLYSSSKGDFATIRFNKALSFVKICCICSFLMLEANVFFWALQYMAARDGSSPYLYMLIINLACSPFFAIFVLWSILCTSVEKDKLTAKSLFVLNTALSIAFFVCATLLLVRAVPLIVKEPMLIKKIVMAAFTLSGSTSMLLYGINFITKKADL